MQSHVRANNTPAHTQTHTNTHAWAAPAPALSLWPPPDGTLESPKKARGLDREPEKAEAEGRGPHRTDPALGGSVAPSSARWQDRLPLPSSPPEPAVIL